MKTLRPRQETGSAERAHAHGVDLSLSYTCSETKIS